jgi:hypothetical protein
MCTPRVTRQASIRHSSSCHTRINMGLSIFFTAAVILVPMLTRVSQELECRMDVCCVTRAHIEHL